MRLAECLNQSDIRNLRTIAERHTFAVPMYSKNSLLQEILSRFNEPNYIVKRTEQLSSGACSALLEIALDGREHYAHEELFALLKRAQPGVDSRQLLDELLAEGMVFATSNSVQSAYVCPADMWRRLHRITADQLRKSVQTSTREPVISRSDGVALARDTVAFLLYTLRNQPKLTQDGVIFKRQQLQLLQLFEVSEDPLPPSVGWRFGFGRRFHDYPDRFALLYDHLYSEGCLEESGTVLHVTNSASEAYLQRTEEERALRLFRYWLKSYRSAIKALPRLVTRIAELTAESWVYADSLFDALSDAVAEYYYEPKQQVFTLRVMQMLVCTGVMTQGLGEGDTILYKLSTLGASWLLRGVADDVLHSPEDKRNVVALAVIQPTFDILVPPEGETAYGWDLQSLATLTQNDRMRQYELTRDSIYNALQTGWREDRILSFLRKISAYELPGNVERTVQGWCNEYGRVKVQQYCVVTCVDECVAAEVQKIAPLTARSSGKLGDTVLAFTPDAYPDIVATLQKLGYLVQTTE